MNAVADLAHVGFWLGMHQAGVGTAAPLPARYLDVRGCATYIGRTEKAVRRLVERGEIPHLKVGTKVQFDRERVDRWLARHAARGRQL